MGDLCSSLVVGPDMLGMRGIIYAAVLVEP